jgi:hypothetical protein
MRDTMRTLLFAAVGALDLTDEKIGTDAPRRDRGR